ncbi:hypothetical protein BASA50_009248 [Batrachochytrium salamandrivorans]|uniref:Uncharacterized protein n=1 Tax=Batrachochytrium salamandrivorans TaxID=1357716 RepID=A0ABQ8F1V7_9FUNG|nr:hypothetical protein BASA50_009248 [Batrachochytrium salamandrivorans]
MVLVSAYALVSSVMILTFNLRTNVLCDNLCPTPRLGESCDDPGSGSFSNKLHDESDPFIPPPFLNKPPESSLPTCTDRGDNHGSSNKSIDFHI